MKAVGYRQAGAIDRDDALLDIDLPRPVPTGHDLLVEVRAVSVNPVDTKVRRAASPKPGQWKVLGYDAAGVVAETGDQVRGFKPGDAVFYAGSINRPGTNSAFHLVDERIVGHKPASLTFANAAALPLTGITAWEMLFDRLDIRRPVPGAASAVLVVGGAGGVGSVAIQLARALTGLEVIATASRPETQAWVRTLSAHHVVDHAQPMAPQMEALGLGAPGHVFITTQAAAHLADVVSLIAPQGRIGVIDDPPVLDVMLLKAKSLSLHWEAMFARSSFTTADMAEQGKLLDAIAALVEEGRLRSTATEVLRPLCAATLREAHARLESGTARGKLVVEGF